MEQVSYDQLNVTLSFFPRVDSKCSVVLGLDVAMIGLLAFNAPAVANLTWPTLLLPAIPALLFLLCMIKSLWEVYKCSFPRLEGGDKSLIYFAAIGKRTETDFVRSFSQRDRKEHIADLLSQVWRNSEILDMKFAALKSAHIYLAWSIVPWVVAVIIFGMFNQNAPGLLR